MTWSQCSSTVTCEINCHCQSISSSTQLMPPAEPGCGEPGSTCSLSPPLHAYPLGTLLVRCMSHADQWEVLQGWRYQTPVPHPCTVTVCGSVPVLNSHRLLRCSVCGHWDLSRNSRGRRVMGPRAAYLFHQLRPLHRLLAITTGGPTSVSL